jgi:iron complex transport system ATP-binding protein
MKDRMCPTPSAGLACTGLTIGVAGRTLVEALELRVDAGDCVAVLGPNGVGKTLTLLTLAGLRPPQAGTISVGGELLAQLPRPMIARRLGMMLQQQTDPFPTTVLETVLLGRHAQAGLWHWESPRDLEVARSALREMDLEDLEQRAAGTLSGGERRRLAMATLLAQDPGLLLLDEPLNHLDPQHRFTVLRCLARLCQTGKAVIASLHDPMLAAQYATHVLLLHGDGRWACGRTATMLTAARLEDLYQTPFAMLHHGDRPIFLPVAPQS